MAVLVLEKKRTKIPGSRVDCGAAVVVEQLP